MDQSPPTINSPADGFKRVPHEAEPVPVVHIVDDDEALRTSLVFLLDSVEIKTRTYPDAATFLRAFDPTEPAVLIVDVRMPGTSGLQLQDDLLERYPAPIIFCSAHGDIPMSVQAVRAGAVDFLEKPYQPQRMLEIVQRTLPEATARFREFAQRDAVMERIGTLTERELEVLRLVVDGLLSHAIAYQLGISVKTVDVHRAHIKEKTQADSIAALVRDVLQAGITL